MSNSKEILRLAEAYINAGFQVHPVHSPNADVASPGKAPKISAWQKACLTFREFAASFQNGDNFGVVMGKSSKMVCIDIDPRNGGFDWYMAVETDLPQHVREATGGGGLHLYFRYPENIDFLPTLKTIAPGVEILADGGFQVVTAPSLHASGGEYAFDDDQSLLSVETDADFLPDWIIEKMLMTKKPALPPKTVTPHSDHYLDQAIQIASQYPPAIQGHNGDVTTFAAAARLRDYAINEEAAFRILSEYYNPRCSPPWDLSDLRIKVANAYKYAKSPLGNESAEFVFTNEKPLGVLSGTKNVPDNTPKHLSEYSRISLKDFLLKTYPPVEHIIGPFTKRSLSMVFAPPGVGKTHFCLNIGFAAATGGKFLKWRSEAKVRVLYIDGEMPANLLQQRLKVLMDTYGKDDFDFQIITGDEQIDGIMPDLATTEGQAAIQPYIDDADFIILDNISCLVRSGNENDAEDWIPVQNWALRQKSKGKALLFVHHAGKSGQQRGTSKKEDPMALIVSLSHPEDYKPTEGARFDITFPKVRIYRNDGSVEPFTAKLVTNDFGSVWEFEDTEDSLSKRVYDMFLDGATKREILDTLNISSTSYSRYLKAHGVEKVNNKFVNPNAVSKLRKDIF